MSRYPEINLRGASVAITGGGRGIGLATAQLFAARGARVAIGDLDGAEAAAKEIDGWGAPLDVTDPASFADFVAGAEAEHGPLDILVNNAGVMPNGDFLELGLATDRMIMEVNLFGVIHGMRAVLPGMLERRSGHVVNVASLAGKFPVKGLAAYNASKFAVVGLTAATRLEYADRGISLTAILPSAVDTALASGLDMRPIPKVKPEAIAAVVVDSVRHRRAEVAVPGYVGLLADVAAVTPTPILDRFRKIMRDDRALAADSLERQDYRDNLHQQEGRRA
ncbi:MAG TPA: SDR family oxidoreductase [Marmoricola sp.]|nr:SDR family oxidoreductase [Marmoricola sp.]